MAEEYLEAKRMGEREKRTALFSGADPYLVALEDSLSASDISAEIDLGLHEIPLSLIVGTRTKGRQTAFASNFMPLLSSGSEFADKWQTLYFSQIEEGLREPIKCYEYLNKFYVEEGNKRVSVMKYLGAYSIHANVIRILPKKTDDLRIRIYYEFLDFYKVTGLFDVVFSQEGRYAQLAACLGQDLVNPWSEKVLDDFRTAFNNFSKIYDDKGGSRLSATTYDAFLVYLNVYSLESILKDSPNEIHRRIGRLWREIEAEASPATVTIADSPEAVETEFDLAAAAGASFRWLFGAAHEQDSVLRVAFLYEKTAQSSSWTYGHELGRLGVAHRLGERIETIYFDNCDTPDAVEKAIDAAITDNCGVIFTTSPSMMPSTRKAAIDNPNVRFLNCSINLSVSTVRTYYSRMYEAKFLMGILAASLSENHVVGYVADYPLYASIANINAFAAGAAMADPLCRVKLIWSSLADEESNIFPPEVRIISGSDFIRPEDENHTYGLYRIEDNGKFTILASPVPEWGRYYELILASVLDESYDAATAAKKGTPLNYWYGMTEG
ncbi:MAG: BMP family ABC transporter substrate-binding protein, partial [Lachnospiraceae bacterium]